MIPVSCFRRCALTLLGLALVAPLPAMNFGHPGLQHTAAQIDRASNTAALTQVTALADQLINEPANALATFDVPGYFIDPVTQQTRVRELQADVRAAYTCALAFQLTGESRYATAARRLVLAWVDTNKTITGYDGPIVMTYLGVGFLHAADLAWSTFTEAELARIRTWSYFVLFQQAANLEQLKHENNHRTWGIYTSLAVAYLRTDAGLFADEVAKWKSHVAAAIAGDGSMPLELARADRAGWYTYFALSPMLAAAQLIQNTTGEQVWDYNNGAMERALTYFFQRYANPDALGAGSSCNPENLLEAMREVYPRGAWLNCTYLPTKPIDASNDQHVAWEYPSLLRATRALATAPTSPTPAPAPAPAGPTNLQLTWLTGLVNATLATITYPDGGQPMIELADTSRVLASRLASTRMAAIPGKTYDFALQASRRSGAVVTIALVLRDASGKVLRTTPILPNYGDWTDYSVSVTAPTNTATVQVEMYSGTTTTGTTLVSAVTLQER